MQLLYEFVLSTGHTGKGFQICQGVPRCVIPLDESTLSECSITRSCVLNVEENDSDVLTLLGLVSFVVKLFGLWLIVVVLGGGRRGDVCSKNRQ